MRFYVVEEAFVPVLVKVLLVKVHEVCQTCVASVGDYDIQATHCGDCFLDERIDGVAAANVCFYGVETRGFLGRNGAGYAVEFFEDVLGTRAVVCIVDHL